MIPLDFAATKADGSISNRLAEYVSGILRRKRKTIKKLQHRESGLVRAEKGREKKS